MKTAVIYKSKTGFTETYAKWISEELSSNLIKAENITLDELSEYDVIVYGGGLYAAGIGGVKMITKNLDRLKGKKIAIFGVGASPPRDKDINEIISTNFTDEQLKKIKFFYMRGGFDYTKLSPLYKIIMTLFKIKLRIFAKRNPDARGMLSAYENPMDFTRKKNIGPLIKYIEDKQMPG